MSCRHGRQPQEPRTATVVPGQPDCGVVGDLFNPRNGGRSGARPVGKAGDGPRPWRFWEEQGFGQTGG